MISVDRKVQVLKNPAVFELMTYIFEANPLTLCATLLVFYCGRETAYKIILVFTVYFDEQYVTIWTSLIPTFKCQISLITR